MNGKDRLKINNTSKKSFFKIISNIHLSILNNQFQKQTQKFTRTLSSDKSLKYLRKGCKYLKKLVIYGCTEVTKETILKMVDKIPLIEHFKFEEIQFEAIKL